jgi:hypothetical protein
MGGLCLNGTVTGKAPKLELGQAPIKVEWGRSARRLEGSARDAKKGPKVTSPGDLMLWCSWSWGQGEKGEKLELDVTEATRV